MRKTYIYKITKFDYVCLFLFICLFFILFTEYSFEAKAATYILFFDLIVCFIMFFILKFSKIKKFKRTIILFTLLFIHFLLLLNGRDWNEGSMHSQSYVIESLAEITDILYGFILLSAFTGFIPFIIYIGFLNFISKITVNLSYKGYFVNIMRDKKEYFLNLMCDKNSENFKE
ncbi:MULTISPECIES: hypothetical protein [Campylobacter]|uniref:hypothetical protein n=1 Tax=Campylobacter TaxID=194 RepID=UPI0023F00ECE|nr:MULTISPECIES: hypothetical protein [Campylobacter]MCI6642149.1 hypothetical protein [Campylobacter sp.]MDD7422260.1 hypothetical protein [Campylobacter hominis]MDY3116683.1 hypothetical protein [Campylobacter hominis]